MRDELPEGSGGPFPGGAGERPLPKALMLIYQFHPAVGGGERQCLKLSAALRRGGIDARVATFHLAPGQPSRDRVRSVPVTRLVRLFPAESNIAPWLAHLFRERSSYDILHVHGANQAAVVAAALAKRFWGKPFLVKFFNSGTRFDLLLAREEKRWPLRSWIRRAALQADAVVATSVAIKADLLEAGFPPSRIETIPNGVTIRPDAQGETKDRRRRELGLPDDACIVLKVGRLSPAKGTADLLEAWKKLRDRHPRAILVSVGGKKVPGDLEKMAGACGGSVRFVPEKTDGALPYLQAADIFVLPSLAEGLSNALLEAQAAGLPSVVSDAGGNPDIVRDGVNGLIVPAGDPYALAGALDVLMASEPAREAMGAAALRRAAAFDIRTVARSYGELYRRLVKGSRIPPGHGTEN